MSEIGVNARRSAVYLLDHILGEEPRLMSELLAAGTLDKLPPDDRARAQRLANQTLRGMERADRLLQKHLNKNPPLTIHNVLRVGTIELCQDGAAAHGVVNTMVNLVARHPRFANLKGLVNAVLRKIAADGPDAWNALRAPRLPKWLRGPLVEAWSADTMAQMEIAHFKGAPLDLTAKGDAAALADSVGGTLLPTGTVRVMDAGQVSSMPGFAEGDWWVQDAAAALPVQIMKPKPGEEILDLCAAPGGKTMQLAASGAVVTAVDSSAPRMTRVTENLARTGLEATTVVKNALRLKGSYDAILLDAPCSGTGTLRRHPDLPFAKDGSEFGALIGLQEQLIDHAWTLLKPGGRMVFCTCSLLPDEGEVQVDEALERHGDMTVDSQALHIDGVEPAWITEEGGLRLRPDYWAKHGGMDGFYIAVLRKA